MKKIDYEKAWNEMRHKLYACYIDETKNANSKIISKQKHAGRMDVLYYMIEIIERAETIYTEEDDEN